MLAGCFPPFDQRWLVWGAFWILLPLFWTARTKRAACGLGYLAGLGFALINVKWLATVSWVGVLGLGAYLALYYAIFAVFAQAVGNPWTVQRPPAQSLGQRGRETLRSLGYAILLGFFWTGLEWVRGYMVTGYGWCGLGVALIDSTALAQCAEFVGGTGLSFLPVFLSAVVVQVARRFYRQNVRGGVRLLHWDFATALIILMLALTVGAGRLHLAQDEEVIPVDVLLVQQDIPQFANRRVWTADDILTGYLELTAEALQREEEAILKQALKDPEIPVKIRTTDLVVWPEVALQEWFSENGGLHSMDIIEQALGYVRGLGRFTHLLGVMQRLEEKSYNSLLAITPENQRAAAQKQHLVIFGEYIPDIGILRTLYKHSAGVEYTANVEPGTGSSGIPIEVDGAEVEVIPSICFEDTVPRQARKFIAGRPQMIVNVTNDGWFHESEGAAQHYLNARFRCIELRRPMVRCANRGMTGVVSVIGQTVDPFLKTRRELLADDGSHFTRGALTATVYVPRFPVMTLYARWGDWFAVLGLGIGVFWALRSFFPAFLQGLLKKVG